MDVVHAAAQGFGVDAFGSEQPVAQGIEGDTTVHGSGIYIDVAYLPGQVFGHRALAARRMAINGNGYLFVIHNYSE